MSPLQEPSKKEDPQGRSYAQMEDDTARSGVASKTVTASGNTTAFEAADLETIEFTANATAVSGTGSPTLVVQLEGSDDGTNWFALGKTVTITAAEKPVAETVDVENWTNLRWGYTVSGTTPSFTFAISTKAKLSGIA